MKTLILILIALSTYQLTAFSQNLMWAARSGDMTLNEYGPTNIATDNSGNVFVTGVRTGDTAKLVTIKYNSQGTEQWTKLYNVPGHGVREPDGITTDNSGNVYVVADVGVPGGYGIALLKYSSTGTELFNVVSSGEDCESTDMCIDAFGYIYICGFIYNQSDNYLLLKYNSSGSLIWSSQYHFFGSDYAYALATDMTGNVYITGESKDSSNRKNFATLKYSPNGTLLWTQRYARNGTSRDEASDITIDEVGNCFVVGRSTSPSLDTAYIQIVKYSPTGSFIWVNHYSARGLSLGLTISHDRNGYPIAFGHRDSTFLTVKYDHISGTRLWTRDFNVSGYRSMTAVKIMTDNFGNAFACGYGGISGSGTTWNFITLKYASNGALMWNAVYNSPYNDQDKAYDMTLDRNGYIYVSGESRNPSPANYDLLTLKYADQSPSAYTYLRNNVNKPITDLSLTYDSLFTFSGMNMSPFYVNDISLTIDTILHTRDSDLEISLIHQSVTDTAVFQVGGTGANFIGTILDDSASTPIANGTAPFTGTFRPTKPLSQLLNTDPDGVWILRVYDRATGNTGMLKAWSLTLTVSQTPIGISQINTEVPDGFKLFQNYPNPFNPKTVIKFQVSSLSSVKLIVFDILGREVTTLVNKQLKPGTYEVDMDGSNFSSGVYFYKLITDGFSETKKLVLIK